ncbi:MAG: signal peptidase I [Limnohabitans sp.]
MPVLTALVLGAFGLYGLAWFLGLVQGNYTLLLLLATAVSGLYWLAERFFFLPQRQKAAQALDAQFAGRTRELARLGIAQVDTDPAAAREKLLAQPWWLDWTAGLFPVIAIIFLLRSFLWEPFKIPSGSMIPTLHIGDLILVNKFHYGIRLPVTNTKLTEGTPVQRGDVMVFRYPQNPSIDYIKRVVGVPGDVISYAYADKVLTVNGQVAVKQPLPDFLDDSDTRYKKLFAEQLPLDGKTRNHQIINDEVRDGYIDPQRMRSAEFSRQCTYGQTSLTCTVPAGHYFMMGDNRDNSEDSRFWGFVPDQNIVGRAFFVWMNFSNFKRIGSFD